MERMGSGNQYDDCDRFYWSKIFEGEDGRTGLKRIETFYKWHDFCSFGSSFGGE